MSQNRFSFLTTRFGLLLLLAWCGCAALGLGAMIAYETTPAATQNVAAHWPEESQLVRDRKRATLLMFVHPRCPCSRASLAELAGLASQSQGRVSLRIVFMRPAGFPEGWEQSGLWKTAQQIPGAALVVDPQGIEADRFRARASGESFLFAPGGELLFHGGITAARGHEGESAGRNALLALINHQTSEQAQSPVFGCPLSNRRSPPAQ